MVKVARSRPAAGVQIVPPFYAYSAQRGLKRVLLDLKAPAGVDAFLRLAEGADAVIESFRPGVVDRLGIGYEAVRARNPGIVYCSTTGLRPGRSARPVGRPRPQLPGRRRLPRLLEPAVQTAARRSLGPPSPTAPRGGMQAALAILAALIGRGTTGHGAYLDVSVADGMLWLMALQTDEYLATGAAPGPGSGHPHRPLRLLRHLRDPTTAVAGRRGHRAPVLRQPVPAPWASTSG